MMISTYICTIFYFMNGLRPLLLCCNLIINKTMKCITLYFSFCLIAISSIAQPNYDFSKLKRERLGRGVIAIRENPSTVAVSWRYLSSDPMNESFDIYRNGEKINNHPLKDATFFQDAYTGTESVLYTVKAREGKTESSYQLPANAPSGYLNIPLNRPEDGTTPLGQNYFYTPNDASIGDVDGDGEYEIILKWDPSNAHDNSHDGYTGEVYVDCYKLNGQQLWRINLGKNVRAGAHYTQFMVYDLDGDGHAEVVMKTADGTVDGVGKVIGDVNADYRSEQGRILTGPEYLTVFNGLTGEAMQTIDYVPERGNLMGWGDSRGNRSDRFLACVAYLDGIHPSVVMCRGYYTRTVLAAFDWDGKELKQRWVFDSNNPGCEDYAGQGNHNLRVGDVDGDECDEIIYGSCAIDHNGKGLYTTKMGHGDAIHLTHFDPSRKGLQVWDCHENKRDGSTYRDAATGEILFQIKDSTDVGRCMAADIDPTQPGVEMWSVASGGIRNVKGEVVKDRVRGLSCNMAVWWDGDLLRELLDRNRISKYNWEKGICERIAIFEGTLSNNGTKANPCLQGDIVGDWREEVLMRTADNTALRLYVSTIPTDYRFHTFLEDPIYRISIATQNVAYNQPTQPGFYFGPELQGTVFRGCEIPGKKTVVNDSNTPLHLLQPAYQGTYGDLTPRQVKKDIDRVFAYIDKETPARVVDKNTGKLITDYTTMGEEAQLERGAFRLASYEWGVTYSALIAAAEATGDQRYMDYVQNRFRFLAEVAPHFKRVYEEKGTTDPQLLQILTPHALDDAGAVCAAMVKVRVKDRSLPVGGLIENYFDFIQNKEYRLADGTFARNRPQHNTLWLDDMFMGIPAVAQMSRYDKAQKEIYLAEAVRQFLQFADRMFIPEKGLYRHGWVESSTDHPAFCWARANGWAMLTACELLDVLPEDYPQRAKVMDYFRAHVRGVTALQSGEGLWHQLLDRNDSYLETSATAIYVYCLAHAINKGWIDAIAYGPVAHLGWHAVAGKINAEGQVEGTCVGTGMAFDPAFYYYRPVNVYAAHGYGPVLWAGAEMISLLKNQYPQMNDSAVQYYQVKQKTTAPIFAIDTEEKKD